MTLIPTGIGTRPLIPRRTVAHGLWSSQCSALTQPGSTRVKAARPRSGPVLASLRSGSLAAVQSSRCGPVVTIARNGPAKMGVVPSLGK